MYQAVSVWLGAFKSEKDFKEYVKEYYNEDGEMVSSFMKDFGIPFYDNQFFEAEFISNASLRDLITPLSYSDFFANYFINISGNFNSVIAIYNFEYSNDVIEKDNVKFIHSFPYQP